MSQLQCIKLDNLSWENVCQQIVDTIGKILRVDIVILFWGQHQRDWSERQHNRGILKNWNLISGKISTNLGEITSLTPCSSEIPESSQKYFVYQKCTKKPLELEILKLTIQSTEEITVIDDICTDPTWQQKCQGDLELDYIYKQANIRSSISIPVVSQDNLIVILTLHHCNQARSWQTEELNLAIIMANQAIYASRNNIAKTQPVKEKITCPQIKAYEKMRALAQREATINRITKAIHSSLEPQVIFNTIVQELGQALKVDSCALSLWTKRDIFVKCVALYNPEETRSIPQATKSWQRTTISLVPIAENPILQKLLTTKQTVHFDDLTQNQNLARHELPWHSTSIALLVVPLMLNG